MIPQIAIHATCHSVTSVNLYSPCLRLALSGLALTSNSSIPSQKINPFENRVTRSGSQTIGTGFLKCMSFRNPNWYHVQNFVVISVSKL